MPAIHQNRVERLKRLEQLLSRERSPEDCWDGAQLLGVIGSAYGQDANDKARRRALQRDLDELVKQGRIEVVNRGAKPLRYRRVGADLDEDQVAWAYTLRLVQDLARDAVPHRQLEQFWRRLLTDPNGPVLDESRLRILPDTLRLQPAEIFPEVVTAVVTALARQCVLRVLYTDAKGVRSDARLHPQALVQRGPLPYLFALKNDETEPVRMYALHRMIRASGEPELPARPAPGFHLGQAIQRGAADFGQGQRVDLELRVRGYLTQLLPVCPLEPGQRWQDEPENSDFRLRIWASLPSTGQLLRWLLAAGDNLEVVAPLELRQVMAAQARKMWGLYDRDGSS